MPRGAPTGGGWATFWRLQGRSLPWECGLIKLPVRPVHPLLLRLNLLRYYWGLGEYVKRGDRASDTHDTSFWEVVEVLGAETAQRKVPFAP